MSHSAGCFRLSRVPSPPSFRCFEVGECVPPLYLTGGGMQETGLLDQHLKSMGALGMMLSFC